MENNHVVLEDGRTIMDIRDTTAEASDVAKGEVFYDKTGVRRVGSGDYMDKVSNPTDGDILITDANGQAVDSGVQLSEKQDTLVSGENIKRINGDSIVGSGDLTIKEASITVEDASVVSPDNVYWAIAKEEGSDEAIKFWFKNLDTAIATYHVGATFVHADGEEYDYSFATVEYLLFVRRNLALSLNQKQDWLVSGESIKTVNGNTLLGSGNLDVSDTFTAIGIDGNPPTSFEDLRDAISAGKVIFYRASNSSNPFMVLAHQITNTSINLIIAQGKQVLANVVCSTDGQGSTTWDPISRTFLQEELVSGESIKTVNNASLLGSGNIDIDSGAQLTASSADWEAEITQDDYAYRMQFDTRNETFAFYMTDENGTARVDTATTWYVNRQLNSKQDTLVSGTNIKTINNQSLLGSGNIDIQGGSSYTAGTGIDITSDVISVDTSVIAEKSDIPTVPTNVSAFTNDAGYITASDIPDDVSAFNNDAGYQNASEVSSAIASAIAGKQNTLSAGNGINIASDTVSADTSVLATKADVADKMDLATSPTAGDILTTDANGQAVDSGVSLSAKQDSLVSGTNIKTLNDQSLLGSGNLEIETTTLSTQVATTPSQPIKARFEDGDNTLEFGRAGDVYEMHIGKDGLQNTAFLASQTYVDAADANLQSQLGTLTDLTTDNKDNLVNAINEVYEKSGEPFRVKQWASNDLNVEIPTCTEDISNTAIPKMVFSIDNVEGADYQIVGMIAYEVFDAASGGNRINCWPVCQFTGNGQKELSVRWMCGGTTRKTAKRLNAWVLLKHR